MSDTPRIDPPQPKPAGPTGKWTNKPDALILADIATDESILDEFMQLYKENPLPRWKFHDGVPFPPRRGGERSLQWYWDRGNPFIYHRDQDGLLWSVRIMSRDYKTILWVHHRREEDYLHEAMEDNPVGGLGPGTRQVAVHAQAIQWALSGNLDYRAPQERQEIENDNVSRLPWDEILADAYEVYKLIYAPKFGREVPE